MVRRCSWGSRLVALGLAWGLALPTTAAAPSAQAQARRLFEAGSLAYDKGRFEDAARAFAESYRLLPKAAIAFSWAQALRRQYFVDEDPEHLRRAAALYRRYLDEVPEGRRRADAVEQLQAVELLLAAKHPAEVDAAEDAAAPSDPDASSELDAATEPPPRPRPPEPVVEPTELIVYATAPRATASVDGGPFSEIPLVVRTEPGPHEVAVRAPGFAPATTTAIAIEGRIIPVEATLEPLPAVLTIDAHDGARVLLDGTELGLAPLPEAIVTAPGRHQLRITAPGRIPYEHRLDLRSGDQLHLDAHTPQTRQRRAAWGLLGGAGGLAAAGSITLGLAFLYQGRAQRVEDGRGAVNLDPQQLDDYNADLDRRDHLRGATIGLLGTAALAGLTGLVLVLSDRPDRRRRRR